jgi:hypothetical protein
LLETIMSKYATRVLIVLLGLFPAIPADAFDLTGYWTSGNGSVYLFAHKDSNVIATYATPNPTQQSTGVKAGDVAFVGDVVGHVISGTFHQRLPLQDRDRCPATWYVTTNMILVVNDDVSVMEGPAIVVHQNEQCQTDGRAVSLVNLKRSRKP